MNRIKSRRDKNIKMTYNNYLSMSTNPTQEYLMISELIDNSISSFEVKYGENYEAWPKGEAVVIHIDFFTNDISSQKIEEIHGKNVKSNSYISVKDNAFGMDSDTLYKSIEIDNKKIINGSNKNIHGRGMKQAAFYFGMGLQVQTNNGNESCSLSIDFSSINDLSNHFEREVLPSNLDKRGTVVKIFNIYYSKIPKYSKLEEIAEALKARFWKYIECGRLEINFESDIKQFSKVIDSSSEAPLYTLKDTVSNFLRQSKHDDSISQITNLIQDLKLEPIKKGKRSPLTDLNKKYIKDTFIQMYSKMSNYEWEYKGIEFGIFDTVKLNLKFWKIDGNQKGFSTYRGIYIHEGGRAIKHGPNNGAYLEWFAGNSHSSGSTDNRFFGEIDITGIEKIRAVNDKSNIEMEKDVRDELNDFIYWNWYIFDKVENFIRKDDGHASKFFNNLSVQDKLRERYDSHDSRVIKQLPHSKNVVIDKNKSLQGDFRVGENNWNITIKEDMSNVESSKIIESIIIDGKNKNVVTIYNNGADIWNRANNGSSTDFYSNVLFPVLVQLSILYINTIKYGYDFKEALNNELLMEEVLID